MKSIDKDFSLINSDTTIYLNDTSFQWAAVYNGPANEDDVSYSVTTDANGNIYAAGKSAGIGSDYDFITIKFNSSGIIQWIRFYNGSGNNYDYVSSIKADASGNVIITGSASKTEGGREITTIKYNSSGIQQWIQIYNSPQTGNDRPYDLKLDNSGNAFITGRIISTGSNIITLKYSPSGSQIWARTFEGPRHSDYGKSISIDASGNVYVAGGGSTSTDLTLIKYNSLGIQQWIDHHETFLSDMNNGVVSDDFGNIFVTGKSWGWNGFYVTSKFNQSGLREWDRYYGSINPVSSDWENSIAVDGSHNIYVCGGSGSSNRDFALIKYNSSGSPVWVKTYNGTGNGDDMTSAIGIDDSGNIIITGKSMGVTSDYDIVTIKYDSSGDQKSLHRFNGLGNGLDKPSGLAIDNSGNVIITGRSWNGNNFDFITIKYSLQNIPALAVSKPVAYSKFISGETDTIRWKNQGWTSYNIKCLLNYVTPSQSEFIIDSFISDTSYVWNIPDSLLSFRSKIVIQNSENISQNIESNIFRIKPYLLTKLNPDSTYYVYTIGRDNWRYENNDANFWFEDWYDQFNYWWIDPFTGRFYPRKYFKGAREKDFPDWVSWVNAFTIQVCYSNFDNGEYSPFAVERWKAENGNFPGSCFGLALSNAMAFNYKSQFLRKYSDFPEFSNPHDVVINNNVVKITNELWTHQMGQPHKSFLNNKSVNTFPKVTLDSLKNLLIQDNGIIKMLGITNLNNSDGGAHMILPYKVEKLFGVGNYNILTYDNNFPDTPSTIFVNTSDFGGNGFWASLNYSSWGGPKGIILSDDVYSYFFTPTIRQSYYTSPFTTDDSIIQIYNPGDADFIIADELGNVSGTINDSSFNNIENCVPVYSFGGFEVPPYMFNLGIGRYLIEYKNINSDSLETFLFTGNESYSYSREQISSNQTDKLFFDGNLSVLNEDSVSKQISISSIVKESTDEKVISIKSLNLTRNDSIKLVNILDEDFKLITYGTQKQYELELNYVTPSGSQRFINSDIVLSENSSHTIMPEWEIISNGTLTILEDIGNNGTIDDTITLNNFSDLNLVLTAFIEGLYDDVINRMISDTVTILLREKIFPFAITDSARADLSSKGKGYFKFNNAQHLAEYYIVVKHRNAIEVWSDSTITLSGNSTNYYSFVDSASFAYGNNLIQVDLYPLSFALYSGDVNQDGIIDGSDQVIIDNDAFGFATGYLVSDLNGDSIVDASDAVIADNNAYNFVSVIKP